MNIGILYFEHGQIEAFLSRFSMVASGSSGSFGEGKINTFEMSLGTLYLTRPPSSVILYFCYLNVCLMYIV